MFFSEAWCMLSDTRLGGCLCSLSGPSPGDIYSKSIKFKNQTVVPGSQRCASGKSATNATPVCAILCVCLWCMHVCVCPVSPWLTLLLWCDCRERLAKWDMHNSGSQCNTAAAFLFFFFIPVTLLQSERMKRKIGRNRVLNINFDMLSASTWGFMNKSQAKPHLFWPHTVHVVKHLCCKL